MVDYPIRTHFNNWALPLSGWALDLLVTTRQPVIKRPLDFARTLTRSNPGSRVAGGPWRQLPEKSVNLLQQKSATVGLDRRFGGIDNVEKPEKSWGNMEISSNYQPRNTVRSFLGGTNPENVQEPPYAMVQNGWLRDISLWPTHWKCFSSFE